MAKKYSWLMAMLFVFAALSWVLEDCSKNFDHIVKNKRDDTYLALSYHFADPAAFGLSEKDVSALSHAVTDYWAGKADTPQITLRRGDDFVSAFSEEELEALSQLKEGLQTCSAYIIWSWAATVFLLLGLLVAALQKRYLRRAYPEAQAREKAKARIERREANSSTFISPAMLLFCAVFLLWWMRDGMSLVREWLTAFSPAFLALPEDGLLRALMNEEFLLRAGDDVTEAFSHWALVYAIGSVFSLVRWLWNRGKTPETNETALEEGNA